jgi:hypothetical protein
VPCGGEQIDYTDTKIGSPVDRRRLEDAPDRDSIVVDFFTHDYAIKPKWRIQTMADARIEQPLAEAKPLRPRGRAHIRGRIIGVAILVSARLREQNEG